MKTNIFVKTASQVGRLLNKNSPTILTGLGVAGFITTVIMSVKATEKAINTFNDIDTSNGETLTASEKIQCAWEYYVPTALMGSVSIACLIGATSINNRRNAALTSLYSIAQSTLQEYQTKVVETIGESKEKKIRAEIAGDALEKTKDKKQVIVLTNKGETLCFDQYTGRYFKSDIDYIKRKVNDFNHRLLRENQLPLNDFYYDIGLESVGGGQDVGWDTAKGLLDIEFTAKINSDNQPCVVLSFHSLPVNLW